MFTVEKKEILKEYQQIRTYSEKLVSTLEIEDFLVQAGNHVSPTKWHLAHTTWFFEKFILEAYIKDYKHFNPAFNYLFNSYYETVGNFHPQKQRGLITRPTVSETMEYRKYVDKHIVEFFSDDDKTKDEEIYSLIEIGLQHEQQHQELILMDIKYSFSFNPLYPEFRKKQTRPSSEAPDLKFHYIEGGLVEIGHDGSGFAFDNESPRHKTYLYPYRLANRPVTNGEYMQFIEANGYQTAEFWLSDGWQLVKKENWKKPQYWIEKDGQWHTYTLAGLEPVDLHAPAAHISFYEADAYARWAGKRLPTEQEWEHAMADQSLQGNFMEDDVLQPDSHYENKRFEKAFGDVWEWTSSPYIAYPKSKPLDGSLGEYNAKFMSNQIVLKGGSCVTPRSHIRLTYRNFFYPQMNWQFSGFRLADDGGNQ